MRYELKDGDVRITDEELTKYIRFIKKCLINNLREVRILQEDGSVECLPETATHAALRVRLTNALEMLEDVQRARMLLNKIFGGKNDYKNKSNQVYGRA